VKLSKDDVLSLLKDVKDPLTGQDIVASGRVGALQIEEDQLRCTLIYTQSLDPQQKSSLNFACMQAINGAHPNVAVHIHLETQHTQGQSQQSVLPQVKHIIAVASGKGGVGKSTVSTNLALGLKKAGYKVGLIDADLYGPSIPTMLGLEGVKPKIVDLHGKQKIVPLTAHGIPVISIGFIVEPEQAVVLRGPRLAGIIKQFIEECVWPELDYLVIDLPPGTGDIQLTLVQTVPLTGVIIVTTPQKVAVADALKALNMFRLPSVEVPILGVLENMAWFTPLELPEKKYYLFGQGGGKILAEKGESTMLGQIPMYQGIMQGGEQGKPVVLDDDHPEIQRIWEEVTDQVIASVAHRLAMMGPSTVVQMQG